MTHAASLRSQIERRSGELTSMTEALARSPASTPEQNEWTSREILLHLVGAMSVIPEHIRLAIANDNPRLESSQRGGDYVDVRAIDTASGAAAVLQQRLTEIAAAVLGLDDATLQRPVTVTPSEGDPMPNLPIGLVVRHAVTEHFDEHMAQLRDALSATAERQRGQQT